MTKDNTVHKTYKENASIAEQRTEKRLVQHMEKNIYRKLKFADQSTKSVKLMTLIQTPNQINELYIDRVVSSVIKKDNEITLNATVKGTLMQILKSSYMFVFI